MKQKPLLTPEMRRACLTLIGLKETDQLCPICETRLYCVEEVYDAESPMFGNHVRNHVVHESCWSCGYEHIVTKTKPL